MGTGPVVVGSDVEIEASFRNVKTIVIPPGCTNCLNKWRDAFTEPDNLQEIVGVENHPEIGVSGSMVYDRRTKCALNLIGNDETVVIPKDIAVWDRELLELGLLNHGVERLHFCGSLPDFHVRRVRKRNSFAKRIENWWKCRTWKNFKPIFAARETKCTPRGILSFAPSNLVVTVSRENADERTKSIVESGMWEGRRISWGEQ